MKNKSLLIASVFAVTAGSVSAQDLTSKKGEPFLPEAGDWAISFDATPFLNYFGQMFSNAGATSPTAGYTNGYPWAIKGKMFKDASTAYRAGIRLGFGSEKKVALIDDASDNAATTPPSFPTEISKVEDTYKNAYNQIVLTGGLEMRKGKTRLQGYYGGELWVGFGGTKKTFEYGNALNTNTDATAVDGSNGTSWGGLNFTDVTTGAALQDDYSNDARYTEIKTSSMSIGLRGFIGVEYFIFPKISVGAEYGWGFGMMSTKTSTSFESRGTNSSGNPATNTWSWENKSSKMAVDTDIQNSTTGLAGGSGALNIIFHF